MELTFTARLKQAWNAFLNNKDPTVPEYRNIGSSYSTRPDRPRLTPGNERSIITSVYNRIAMDAAAVKIRHIREDTEGRYVETLDSGLNNCLSLEANVDQTGRAFIQDVVMSMLDEGAVAIVPVQTTVNPRLSESYDIESMRVGRIVNWYPDYVKVRIYNDKTGEKEELTLPKSMVAIIENPFYAVMNEPNAVAKRLVRKLNILDVIDEQSASGKLDLIVQLPGIIKTEARKKQAEDRRRNIEEQLAGTKYGIAYIDGTEKITQLNRSIENNLMNQITFLTSMLYSQLGITEEILQGKADEQTMLNYHNNTVAPVVNAIVQSMRWKFLTKTARTRHHSIKYFRDPFKNTPVDKIAELTDKFTRNEVASSNEMRSVIGWKPVDDPRADELRNKNLNAEAGYDPISTGENNEEGGNLADGIPEDVGKMKLSELSNL